MTPFPGRSAGPGPDRPAVAPGRARARAIRRRAAARGASLVEALLGSLVLAGGLLATGQGLVRERQASDAARERAEALRLAQQGFERLRAGQPLPSLAPAGADADAAPTLAVQALAEGGVLAGARRAEVRWTDRHGRPQSLALLGWLPADEAAGVLAWRLPPRGRDAARLHGRHAAVPREARALGDGRSLHRPVPGADEAWLFDDTDGRIVARCRVDPAAGDTAPPTDCRPSDALRVAGWVHRAGTPGTEAAAGSAEATGAPAATGSSLTGPGVAATPPAYAVSVVTEPDGAAEPCLAAAVRLVQVRALGPAAEAAARPAASPAAPSTPPAPPALLRGVALDAQPPPGEHWVELGERRWQFECAVPRRTLPADAATPARRGWSGRLRLVPLAAVGDAGTAPAAPPLALCRYSADTDGQGGIDRPAEAPATYAGVTVALPAVGFLAVEAGRTCPARPPADAAGGRLPWSQANPATVPHDTG